jgi:alpha-tubulin suppressor-like RCC1 family protein
MNRKARIAMLVVVGLLGLASCRRAFAADSRTLRGFGSDLFGELGDGHHVNTDFVLAAYSAERVSIQTRRGVRAVAAGGAHSLYIDTEGSLWAVGSNSFGQLGDGTIVDRCEPILVANNVIAVAAGPKHSAYVTTDGSLWAMGDNSSGQLGDGTFITRSTPVRIHGDVTSVVLASGRTFFRTASGELWATGRNDLGQLGDGSLVTRNIPVMVRTSVAMVAAGESHTLVLQNDHTAWGVGLSGYGQFGTVGTRTTIFIQLASDVMQVAAGDFTSYFLKTDGTVLAAGRNAYGEVGDGTTTDRDAFVPIASNIASIRAGGRCALLIGNDKRLFGTGMSNFGQLGGSLDEYHTPVTIALDVMTADTGGRHALFVKTDTALWAVGNDSDGQLCDGRADARWTPITISQDVVGMAVGTDCSFFIKSDGTLWATGYNWSGCLGDGSTTQTSTPVLVSTDVKSVSTSGDHTLFVKVDGTLWGMGYNSAGQLGIPDKVGESRDSYLHSLPERIAADVTSASCGDSYSLFVKNDGTLWAMGYNTQGQLGDGTRKPHDRPVQVAANVAVAVASKVFSLFLRRDGTLWGMGENLSRQLGDGQAGSFLFPKLIASGVVSMAAGFHHTVFIKEDGSLWGLGDCSGGQFDNGTFNFDGSGQMRLASASVRPTWIAADVSSCAAGFSNTFFLKKDGTLWATGFNSDGQLGDGATMGAQRYQPVKIADNVNAVCAGDYHTLVLGGESVTPRPSICFPGGVIYQGGSSNELPVFINDPNTPVSQLTLSATSSNPALLPNSHMSFGGRDAERTLALDPMPKAYGTTTVTLTVSNGSAEASMSGRVLIMPADRSTMFTDPPKDYTVDQQSSVYLIPAWDGNPPQQPMQWQVSTDDGASWAELAPDAPYSGVHSVALTIDRSTVEMDGYKFRLIASNGATQIVSAPMRLLVRGRGNLTNISSRAYVGTGDSIVIAGFVVRGTPAKRTLVRASGPALDQFGVTGVLRSPALALYQEQTAIAQNTIWGTAFNSDDIRSASAQVGAFPWDAGSEDSGLYVTIPAAKYSALLSGSSGKTGVALIEVYDADSTSTGSQVVNISTRALVKNGDGLLIAGFTISGNEAKHVLIRASGPALQTLGMTGCLADPVLQLFRRSSVMYSSEWGIGNDPTEITTAADRVGAYTWPQNSRDPALLLLLAPGSYTAQVSSRAGNEGIALIEVYDAD